MVAIFLESSFIIHSTGRRPAWPEGRRKIVAMPQRGVRRGLHAMDGQSRTRQGSS
jgi:hypothetical protein